MEQSLDISWKTIAKIFLAAFVFYVFFLARDIVVLFFFALIISLLIEPAINFLNWLKLPRVVAAVLIYLSIFGFMGLLMYLTAPIFIFEITQFSQHIPEYFEKFSPILKEVGVVAEQNFEQFTASFINILKESSAGIVRAISALFGGIYSALLIFTLAFFISLEKRGAERVLAMLLPKKYESQVVTLFERAQFQVSGWFGARIMSCLFVAVTSFAIFFLLDVKFAFILALISGVLNFVPYVGPTLAMVLAVLFVGVSNSWMFALYVFIAVLVIQEIENKVLTPVLMKRFIDLPPVLVLVALLVGGTIFGFLGTIFAVPVFGIIYEFLKDFLQRRRQDESFTLES